MKSLKIFFLACIITCIQTQLLAQGSVVAFYTLGTQDGTIESVVGKVEQTLKGQGFNILGKYRPGNDSTLYVLAFTSQNILNITLTAPDRGALASAMKIGFVADSTGGVEVILLNPDYLFYAYLRDHYSDYEADLFGISTEIKIALSDIGMPIPLQESTSLETNELKQYRFLPSKPSFDEPIQLGTTFATFDNAISVIKRNLNAKRGGAYKVYEIISFDDRVAVFGIGLLDNRTGENNFLPMLGKKQVAAMPYELIVSDTQVTILDGSFRFPLYWSNLSTKQLLSIRKIPREIQDIMEALTK